MCIWREAWVESQVLIGFYKWFGINSNILSQKVRTMKMTRNVYLDTETTSLIPGSICQLSMIIEDESNTSYKNYFFKVSEMDAGAERVHGLSIPVLDTLSNGDTFASKQNEIFDLLNGSNIIGHNVDFDTKFISCEFFRLNRVFTPASTYCTMKSFTPVLKLPKVSRKSNELYKYPKLEEVIEYLGINLNAARQHAMQNFGASQHQIHGLHDARLDTYLVYIIVQVSREIQRGEVGYFRRLYCSR